MKLPEACLALQQQLGQVAMCLHRDHICAGEWSHGLDACPAAPYYAFSAADVAAVETTRELQELMFAKADAQRQDPTFRFAWQRQAEASR